MLKLVVFMCLLAAAAANLIAPWGGIAPLGLPLATTPLLMASNYRGPLSLAPGQPANIIAADGRPLDTLDVNLDRSAHWTAKALESGDGVHLLKKRSVSPWIAPLAPLAIPAPLALSAPLWTPSNYRGPLSLAPGQPANIIAADGRPLDTLDVNLDRSAHITAKALTGNGIHLLKKRSASLIAPLAVNRVALAPAPIVSPLAVSRVAVAPAPIVAPLAAGWPTVLSTGIAAGPLTYSRVPL